MPEVRQEVIDRNRRSLWALYEQEDREVAEHLRHMTDGQRHEGCRWCLVATLTEESEG